MKGLRVGSATAARGAMGKGWLKVGDLPHGRPVEVPVIVVNGAKDGPTLWVQAAIHGNEYTGTFAIHRFVAGLDPRKLAGNIVAVPALNITAYQHGTRGSPFDIYGGSDMNRVFPGKADGTFTEQMAYHVYAQMKRVASALIDFHTAYMPNTRWSLYSKAEGKVGETAEGMARAFGWDVILPTPPSLLSTSAFNIAARDGIPGMIVEAAGKGPAFSDEVVRECADQLRNVARYLRIVPEPVRRPKRRPIIISDFAWVRSRRGGLFRPTVTCGNRVRKGQVIGHFHDMFGALVEEAVTPYAGVVLNMHPGPLLVSGDTLIHVGLKPRLG